MTRHKIRFRLHSRSKEDLLGLRSRLDTSRPRLVSPRNRRSVLLNIKREKVNKMNAKIKRILIIKSI